MLQEVALYSLAPTSRATCRVCKDKIEKGTPRVVLQLECYRGSKNASPVHSQCLGDFPQVHRLELGDILNVEEADERVREEIERVLSRGEGGVNKEGRVKEEEGEVKYEASKGVKESENLMS